MVIPRINRVWKATIDFFYKVSQGYALYNRLDVVYKYGSRGLPMPSPVPASTDEEPTSWIHH